MSAASHRIPVALITVLSAAPAAAQEPFDRLRDRGPGVPVSMFGTYILPGELIVYTYYEYYHDDDAEYKPLELGYGLDRDFRGRYRAHEGLIFVGYGISDRLGIEFEAAVITARQDRSPEDPSEMPARVEESGLGDVESQLRWRWRRETEGGPGVFSAFQVVFPLQRGSRRLIGTQDWELKFGTGLVRGFRWGTGTLRLAMAYDEGKIEPGEYAVEYLKRVSPLLRLFGSIEGSEDEVELITETQWSLTPGIIIKLNNAFGITSKATGWAPEVGVMFRFP